jgi:hypothetical protein
MNDNQIQFSNLENLPNLESLTGITTDTAIIDLNDPLGTSHYTYTEHCNISKDIRDAIEYDLGLQRLLAQGWQEESSVYWIMKIFQAESCPNKKLALLHMAQEEHSHFMMFINLAKILYPATNPTLKYAELRTSLDSVNSYTIFKHFHGEVIIATELKYDIKNTNNMLYRNAMKFILAEESTHISAANKFKVNPTDRKKIASINYLFARMTVHQGMNYYNLERYKTIFKKYNVNYDEQSQYIKQSQKSKDYVTSVITGMFNLARSLNIIEHDNFEKYLDDAKITERYNAYL